MVIYPNEEATDYISTSRLALYNYICSNNVSFLVNFNFKRNKITRIVTKYSLKDVCYNSCYFVPHKIEIY